MRVNGYVYIKRFILLGVLLFAAMLGFMIIGAKGSWNFILPFRAQKLLALLLVGTAIATSTVLFQTIAHNRILTPSIMGFDALYMLLVTLGVFFLGAQKFIAISAHIQFIVSLALLIGTSLLLFGTLLLQEKEDLLRMILTGLVFAVLFRSLTDFAARMIDPNEYTVIQTASYAQFNRIETDLLGISALLLVIAMIVVWRMRRTLDVLAIGREAAINLGEDPKRGTIKVLILIAILVSVSTALVGPVAFLGLLVVSMARLIIPTGTHAFLLTSSAMVSCITLIGGQTLLERLLGLRTPLSVVIDFIGGIVFMFMILKRK